ncbi:hypothetical protein P9112_003589 [Eukaryota sp. TZLM1-RC]
MSQNFDSISDICLMSTHSISDDNSSDSELLSNINKPCSTSTRGRGRGNRSRSRGRGRGFGPRGRGRGAGRGGFNTHHGKTSNNMRSESPLQVSHNDVSLFWNVACECGTPSITVYFSKIILSDPQNPPYSHELTYHSNIPDLLCYDTTLPNGFYFVYFYRNGCFVINPTYPVHFALSHNFVIVERPQYFNPVDLLPRPTANRALLFQLEYYFSDDNFAVGTAMHTASLKTETKPDRWVPFEFIIEQKFFNSLARKYNVKLSAEFLHELTQQSESIQSDLKYGIRRKTNYVPSRQSQNSRKLAFFPLQSTDEVLDVVDELHSLNIAVSSFISYFKRGCKAIRAVVYLKDPKDASVLLEGSFLRVNGKELIIRYDHHVLDFGNATSPR